MVATTTELAPPTGLWSRLTATVTGWVRQLLAPIDVPFSTGGTAVQVEPGYRQLTAMSAMAVFPWPRACIRAKCDDVGGLPLVAVVALAGNRITEQLDDHPFLRLIRNPSPGITETVFRRQLEADFGLAGNAYIWLRAVGDGWELHRLHPEHTKPEVRSGVIVAWRYGDRRLSVREVFPIRDICWSADLTAVFGESAIRTLDAGLRAVQSSRDAATKAAARGRPDVIFSVPKESGLGAKAASEINDAYAQAMVDQQPSFTVGGGTEATTTSWAPKDIEFPGLDQRVRDETLAVLRVPPTRAGIPQANYAVAKAELRDYWGSLVVSDLKLFEDAYTAIAHIVGGSLAVVIRHDVSSVEALQTSYDQRQARAGFWVTVMGATPSEAAAYEGFRDAPVGDIAGTQDASRPAKEVDDQPNRQAAMGERALSAYLATAADRLQGGGGDPDAEVYRLAGVLELARYAPDEAIGIAREVAPVICELAAQSGGDRDLGELYAFSATYARAVICRPRLALAAK